jgi:alpha-N-arabinofuranosidase
MSHSTQTKLTGRDRLFTRGPVLVACCLLIPLCLTGFESAGRTRQPLSASIRIDAAKVEGRISPTLYGQFLEFMFEGIKGGLHAELLRNRGFEEAPNVIGLSRYWERYSDDRNDDYGLNFKWDGSTFYPAKNSSEKEAGGHSLRIDAGGGVVEAHGVYQGRVPVRRDVGYNGYIWIKAADFNGQVSVALENDVTGGERYAASEINNVAGDWKKYQFALKPAKSDPLARFAILISGRGRLWVDQVSLMPGDAVDGVRADVLEKVKALRPAFVRWPGGNVAQDYHGLWGVGPRDRRATGVNLSWKNEAEPSDFGTDEFIRFCRNVGAEPSITVNVEGRGATAEEAAGWVEYCNGPATSKYGSMRASNGHPEPYGVKYWEVGNEIWGDWVRGHSDAETYARNFNRYSAAMRAVDPAIKLIAVGDNDLNWDRAVLRLAGRRIDYLAIHHYYGRTEEAGDPLNLMARPLFFEKFYSKVEGVIRDLAPGRDIRLAINEWGLDLPERRQYSMESALYAARLMNVFERSNGLVAMSAVSDLVNGWPGGVIQASRHGVFVTPIYLVNMLYNNRAGAELLRSEVESPAFDSSREGKGVPYLDATASRSGDGRLIFVKAVNTNLTNAIVADITLAGVEVLPGAQVETVTADSIDSANGFSSPDQVSIRSREVKSGSRFSLELPKHSVSVITIKAGK